MDSPNETFQIKQVMIPCECHTPEHTLYLTLHYPHKEEEADLFVTYFLDSDIGFWKRFLTGIKYIFGYKCAYGHFGSTIITTQYAAEIKDVVDEYLRLLPTTK